MSNNTVDPNDVPDFNLSQEELDRIKKGAKESTEEDYLKDLGKQHTREMKELQNDEYLIEAYPEAQELVVQKLDEYWDEAAECYKEVKEIRNIVDKIQADPFSKWFFTNVENYKQAGRLKWLYQQIKRLERLKIVYEKKKIESLLKFATFETKEERKRFNLDKMFARQGLLLEIVQYDGINLRSVGGGRVTGLCPFHNEKTPSFFVYQDNWYHCYGCGAHGNFIDYLMKIKKLEFKAALEEADRFM